MADATPTAIQINIKGPSELKLQIDISTDKTVRELKQAIADKSDVDADRQRLIYSGASPHLAPNVPLTHVPRPGRVLKDEDPLSNYKIQTSHTIHMVKGAARATGASGSTSSSTTTTTTQPLPQMQTGQNVHDPLTQLNGHQGFGVMGGFNPFADMGLNPTDPNMLQNMLNSPEFLQQMSTMMSNPQVLDQIIASNPQFAQMGPQFRETLQSERFRQMISNPDALRSMLQMSAMMRDSGLGPQGFGGAPATGPGSFPAPGAHAGAPAQPAPPNPNAAPNPFGNFQFDPSALAGIFGGGAGGAFGAGAGGAFGAPAAPADTRSPEERFQVQLQQLQDMGFTNAQQNVRALLATAGNVHSAIEYILGGGGL
ncbi:hypothetical protein OF83DRAFT_710554 [Amylostereum chailletii]|nr:hypothetical protein OF83DRAFT_710554 [Amylostereum chailletii]